MHGIFLQIFSPLTETLQYFFIFDKIKQQVDDEQHSRDQLREQLTLAERRVHNALQEKDELSAAFDHVNYEKKWLHFYIFSKGK